MAKLKSEIIYGRRIQFVELQNSPYFPGKYAGMKSVQARMDNKPLVEATTKKGAIRKVKIILERM